MGENYSRETEAPFNMAIATLKRLDTILQQIRAMDFHFSQSSAEKQKSYISLVKQFYINAVPLLKEEDVEEYKKEILGLDVKLKHTIISGVQKQKYLYNVELEIRLNEILIELQQKLKKFFMPKGKDPGGAVGFG